MVPPAYPSEVGNTTKSRFPSLFDSLVTVFCSIGRLDAVDSDEETIHLTDSEANEGETRDGSRPRMLHGRRIRPRSGMRDSAYFMYLLRTGFPNIWESIIASTGDTVVCVPQSTSLMHRRLSRAEALAHVLFPSKDVPGEFLTSDNWVVTIVGNEVVTGEGFPETRRVRLMVTEDLVHYLDKSGQTLPRRTLASRGTPKRAAHGPVDANLSENLSDDDVSKQLSMSKVTSRKAERGVRLLHISRPLVGGLPSAPENAGELDIRTVAKYTSVLKSYPEMESVFAEMNRFAKDVKSYCLRSLALSAAGRNASRRPFPLGGALSISGILRLGWLLSDTPADNEVKELRGTHRRAASAFLESTVEGSTTSFSGKSESSEAPDMAKSGVKIAEMATEESALTTGKIESKSLTGERTQLRARDTKSAGPESSSAERRWKLEQEQQAKLYAVVAAQWKRSAATMERSRCVLTDPGDDARERREVTLMQVAESYLVARLAPGLFPWMVERNAYADGKLFQAIDLLQNHTQEDIGVKPPFQCDLSIPVACLRELKWRLTPMDKMLQMRECQRLIQAVVQQQIEEHREINDYLGEGALIGDGGASTSNPNQDFGSSVDENLEMATDDLVLLLVCCIIASGSGKAANMVLQSEHRRSSGRTSPLSPETKSDIADAQNMRSAKRNRMAEEGHRGLQGAATGGRGSGFISELAYVKALHFCEDSASPLGFALSNFEVAVEWLLAKVGLQLSETRIEGGFGSLLTVEKRLVPVEAVAPQGSCENDDVMSGKASMGGGGWGGDALSSIPPCVCDLALRDNVRAELEKYGSGGPGTVKERKQVRNAGGRRDRFSMDDFRDPTDALPWEGSGELEQGSPTEGREVEASSVTVEPLISNVSPSEISPEEVRRVQGPCVRDVHACPGDRGGDEGPIPDACNRVMVFGDAGLDQATMFEIHGTDGDAAIEENNRNGKRDDHERELENTGAEAATDAERSGVVHANDSRVDVVQAACGPQYFVAVTRGGQLHTWGREMDGRLGHGVEGARSGGAGREQEGEEGREAAGSANPIIWVKSPTRVMLPGSESIVQVSCGARHVLALTAGGNIFAWGDNRYGQCGVSVGQDPHSSSLVTSRGDCALNMANSSMPGRRGSQREGTRSSDERYRMGRNRELGNEGTKIPRPTLVLLRRSADSGVGSRSARRLSKTVDTLPLRVLQVACGREHSLALACSRVVGASSTDVGTHARNQRHNLVFTWGRSTFGSLGRSVDTHVSSSTVFPQFPPSQASAPHTSTFVTSHFSRRSGNAVDRINSDRCAGGRRDGSGCFCSSPDRHPPAEVVADWSYRVNDHRDQGAPLRYAPPPPLSRRARTSAHFTRSGVPDSLVSGTATPPDAEASGGKHFNPPSASPCQHRVAPARVRGSDTTSGLADIRFAGAERGPVAIAAGWRHSLVVTQEGAVFVWGCGKNGRLGLGEHADVQRPQQVRALASRAIPIRAAAAGRAHTLFLSDSGIVYACGSNAHGQCSSNGGAVGGEGYNPLISPPRVSSDILVPRLVRGPLAGFRVQTISAGEDHSAAITFPVQQEGSADRRSRVFTWGLNEAGQCAQGRTAGALYGPQEAELLSGARTLGCGAGHTLVVL